VWTASNHASSRVRTRSHSVFFWEQIKKKE
jgi:hypothetical protein